MISEGSVLEGKRRWGKDPFAQQAALSYEMRKAMEDDDVKNIRNNFGRQAKSWGMTNDQTAGAWIGAAFENQNQHLEFKHTSWSKDKGLTMNHEKLVKEVYEKRGSYPMAQMNASTITQLEEAYDLGDQFTKDKVAEIAKTFEMRGGVSRMEGDGDDAVPVMSSGSGGSTISAPGAGHVNEAVERLVKKVNQNRPQQQPRQQGGAPPNPPGDEWFGE